MGGEAGLEKDITSLGIAATMESLGRDLQSVTSDIKASQAEATFKLTKTLIPMATFALIPVSGTIVILDIAGVIQ